jgi:hypothetical protein
MSPFVSDSCLSRLKGRKGQDILISRPDEIAKLKDETIAGFKEVLVLNPSANLAEESEATMEDASGIHAKLFIAEAGGQARIWTGSANATHAAFNGNVEFLAEFVGDRTKCGIDAFLTNAAGQTTFRDLLQPFDPQSLETDAEGERLESIVEAMRCELASRNLMVRVSPVEGESLYTLTLELDATISIANNVTVSCRPITLQESMAVPIQLKKGTIASFSPVSFAAITSFVAFEIAVTENKRTVRITFVLNARLEGAPADRLQRILRTLLSDKAKVLRFILLLLAEGGSDARAILMALQRETSDSDSDVRRLLQFPLFEALVRTLNRNPKKLDQISRLVTDLKKSAEGQSLLPDGFDDVWQPIWAAREGLSDEDKATR